MHIFGQAVRFPLETANIFGESMSALNTVVTIGDMDSLHITAGNLVVITTPNPDLAKMADAAARLKQATNFRQASGRVTQISTELVRIPEGLWRLIATVSNQHPNGINPLEISGPSKPLMQSVAQYAFERTPLPPIRTFRDPGDDISPEFAKLFATWATIEEERERAERPRLVQIYRANYDDELLNKAMQLESQHKDITIEFPAKETDLWSSRFAYMFEEFIDMLKYYGITFDAHGKLEQNSIPAAIEKARGEMRERTMAPLPNHDHVINNETPWDVLRPHMQRRFDSGEWRADLEPVEQFLSPTRVDEISLVSHAWRSPPSHLLAHPDTQRSYGFHDYEPTIAVLKSLLQPTP